MYRDAKIAVVVPAYNEQVLVARVIDTMPSIVDLIVVVDDSSQDSTSAVVKTYCDKDPKRVILMRHEVNQGVGGSILTGHRKAVEEQMDIVVVMAGDAQMDPAELTKILDPVVEGRADYAKGNRFINGEAWRFMPRVRYFGNAALSMLNKIVSGYWHISDPQCGYTAITTRAIELLNFEHLHKRYFFENSMLIQLNALGLCVVDVPVRAIYGIGESSGIRYWSTFLHFTLHLFTGFFWRLKDKYIIRDFHPLVFFYALGLFMFPSGLLFGIYLIYHRLWVGLVEATSALFATFVTTSGMQFLLLAMLLDREQGRPKG